MMDTMEWPDDIEAAFDMRRANYFFDCITNGIRVEIPQRNVREVVVVQISDRVLCNLPYPRASGVRCVVARRLREFLNQSAGREEALGRMSGPPSLAELLSRFESLEEMAMLDAVTIDPPEVDRFDHDV